MSRNQRPGGLTALGVIHILMFLLEGFGLLIALIQFSTAQDALIKSFGGITEAAAFAGASGLLALLFLINGLGLLRTGKMLGRNLAIVVALVSIARGVALMTLAPASMGVSGMAGLVYTTMAAVLVWTAFRRDFTAMGAGA